MIVLLGEGSTPAHKIVFQNKAPLKEIPVALAITDN